MKPTFTQLAAVVTTCGALCSCNITQQRLDYSWFKDSITSAQDDQVTVESGAVDTTSLAASSPVLDQYTPAPPEVQPTTTQPKQGWWSRNFGQQQTQPGERWTDNISQGQQAPEIPVKKPATQPTIAAAGGTYTVSRGDTLSAIASRHGVTIASLISANALTNPDALSIGQVLTIPGASATPAPKPMPKPAAPAAPAPQTSPSLPPVTAPAPTPAPAPQPAATSASGTYVVCSGDTMVAIARRHNVTLQQIMQANNMTEAQAAKLSIGQRIIIPR